MRLFLSVPVLLAVLLIGGAFGLTNHQQVVALFLGIGVSADLLTSVCFAVFQAHDRFELLAVVLIAQRWVTALAGIGALWAGAGVETVALIYLVGSLGALALALTLMRRRVVAPARTVDATRWPALFREAAPIGLSGAFYVVIARADAALLAVFESDRIVGQYGAATRLLEGSLFISFSVAAGAFPAFSRNAANATAGENLMLSRAIKLALAPSLLVALVTAILSEPLVDLLFGNEYADAASALALLAPAMALFPIGFVCSYWLIAMHVQRKLTVLFGGVAVLNVALNLALIPVLSLDGAAIALTGSQVAIAAVAFALARRNGGLVPMGRTFSSSIVAACLAGAALLLLQHSFAAALTVGVAVYAVTLAGLERWHHPDDAALVLARLRRGGGAGPTGLP